MESCATGDVWVMDISRGIVIGITVALILELAAYLRRQYKQNKQRKWFKALIKRTADNINKATSSGVFSQARMRALFFEIMIQQLRTALDTMGQVLSDKDHYDLRFKVELIDAEFKDAIRADLKKEGLSLEVYRALFKLFNA